jgi:hypothetical protein
MAEYVRNLIQPDPDDLRQTLAQAARVANGRTNTNRVLYTKKSVERAVAEAAAAPEGLRCWERTEKRARRSRTAVLSHAWWSDALGRRHHRIAVRGPDEPAGEGVEEGEPLRPQDRPPLWHIYPGRVWLRLREGGAEVLVWCRCGACGTPAAVAWMGECCGPCHDRREEGSPVPDCGPEQTVLAGHSDAAFGLAFSPDGRTLATGSMDCTVKLWDMATGRERTTLGGHENRVDTLAYSPDGRLLASGDDEGRVLLRRTEDLAEVARLRHQSTGFLGFGFTPDGRHFAVKHRRLTVWDLNEKAPLKPRRHDLPGAVGGRGRLAIAAGGRLLATNADDESGLVLWDRRSGAEHARLDGHRDGINCVAASPDGRTVASGGNDTWVRLWDVQKGQERLVLRGHTGNVWGVAFSPDGAVMASAGSYDQTLRLWDAATGEELAVLAWHLDAIFSVAFSPDSRWLATGGGDGTVRLWPWRALLQA